MCFIFRNPSSFKLFSLFPHPVSPPPPPRLRPFPQVSVRAASFILQPTCPPAHQTHPRWASVLNSKLKTHYRAISPSIMLSNDLISLSVSPVSHQRPRQPGRPCPRVPAALRYHCRRRRHSPCLGMSSSETG